jgi:uncharacterized protein YndB with AHSA1/START domain
MTMSREFEIRREVELPAPPEAVWDAITAGTAAWLFPVEVEGGEGGASGMGPVTAWDPPRHFAVRVEGEDGWFNALEHIIEAREGGTAFLRYVHSGIFTDDWDAQYDGASEHTDFYLHTLGQYLKYFNGRPVTYVGKPSDGIPGPAASAQADGFDRLRDAIGLGNGVAEGDAVTLTPAGLEPVDGVVDYLRPNFVGVRTADGLYRFYGRNAFGHPVGMAIHLFREGADAQQLGRAWQDWLNGVYA